MSTRKIEIKRRQLVVCVFAAVYLFLVSGRLSPSRENSDEAAHFRAKMQIRVSERVASLPCSEKLINHFRIGLT